MTFDIHHARWEKHVQFVQYATALAMLELFLSSCKRAVSDTAIVLLRSDPFLDMPESLKRSDASG